MPLAHFSWAGQILQSRISVSRLDAEALAARVLGAELGEGWGLNTRHLFVHCTYSHLIAASSQCMDGPSVVETIPGNETHLEGG